MFCVYSLLEFFSGITAEANVATSSECVFVCDIADAHHKRGSAADDHLP